MSSLIDVTTIPVKKPISTDRGLGMFTREALKIVAVANGSSQNDLRTALSTCQKAMETTGDAVLDAMEACGSVVQGIDLGFHSSLPRNARKGLIGTTKDGSIAASVDNFDSKARKDSEMGDRQIVDVSMDDVAKYMLECGCIREWAEEPQIEVERKKRNLRKRTVGFSPKDMANYIQKKGVEFLDACFVDPFGSWHHITMTAAMCSEKNLKNGWAVDGSSISLFRPIDRSDMIFRPDITSCWIDPFARNKTLHVTCDVIHPSGQKFDRCPRTILKHCTEYIANLGIADEIFIGPEPEFFMFDRVYYDCSPNRVSYTVDVKNGSWNTHKKGHNLAHRPAHNGAYACSPPLDKDNDIRGEMLSLMGSVGIHIEKHHGEVAVGQHEIGLRYDTPVETADNLMTTKYIVKNVAARHNKSATFMPKPIATDNGNGLHMHISLWKEGANLFLDKDLRNYGNLSKTANQFIAGVLKHAASIMAFTNPTTNSYKRLVDGFEAPTTLAHSEGSRLAAIRIPMDGDDHKSKRIELRFPDPSCNPYLAIAAILLAGVDGIRNQMTATIPLEEGNCEGYMYDTTPASLDEALDGLEEDCDFLKVNGIFSSGFINVYIEHKRKEIEIIRHIPHPKEFEYYYST